MKFKCITFVLCALLLSSQDATATINITQGLPDTLRKCQGNSLTLSISATSDSVLTYAWKRNGFAIGTNSPVFNIASLNTPDAGVYTLDIKETNTPNAVTLTCYVSVNLNVTILTQPTGNSPLCENTKLTILADAINTASVVWTKNGLNTTTIRDTFTKDSIKVTDTGWYQLMIKALPGCRDTSTNKFYVDVRQHLRIITQPQSAGLRNNANLSYVLRVETSGSGPFSFQWFKDDNPISGQVADSFKVLNFITIIDSGKYYVKMNSSSPCLDTLRTLDAYLYPTLCPIIVSQLYNSKVMGVKDTVFVACKNGLLNIEVNAVGVKGYQWSRNGFPISGAVYSRYTISDMLEASAGYYSVEVKSDTGLSCSLITSRLVRVDVKPRQAFTMHPKQNEKCDATTHTMTVSASNTDSYQWLKNGSMIPGATSNSYTVNAVDLTINSYVAHAINSYCPPFPSNTVYVRQVVPSNMVGLDNADRLDLREQCTDNNGWTYYAHPDSLQKMLIAIRKNGNMVNFRPDVRYSISTVKEFAPDAIQQNGVLMGLRRMFTIRLDSGQQVTKPYDVKFYYSNFEKNDFVNNIYRVRTTDYENFSTRWPFDQPSFITSTQTPMTDSLIRFATYPFRFANTIATDVNYGAENLLNFASINKLIASKGGGTFYFDYYTYKSTSGIQSADKSMTLSLYPNPATDVLNIDYFSTKNDMTLNIYDQVGKMVSTTSLKAKSKSAKIDVSNLANGNYFVSFDNGSQTVHSKLTISK